MAEICESVITYLKTIAGVTALVGSGTSARIYNQESPPQHAPRSDAANLQLRPALCITKSGDENIVHLGGRSALNVADIQISSYAATPSARNSLCSAVYAALTPSATETMGSVPIAEITCVQRQTDADALPSDGSDQRVYMASSAYRVWYYE